MPPFCFCALTACRVGMLHFAMLGSLETPGCLSFPDTSVLTEAWFDMKGFCEYVAGAGDFSLPEGVL